MVRRSDQNKRVDEYFYCHNIIFDKIQRNTYYARHIVITIQVFQVHESSGQRVARTAPDAGLVIDTVINYYA